MCFLRSLAGFWLSLVLVELFRRGRGGGAGISAAPGSRRFTISIGRRSPAFPPPRRRRNCAALLDRAAELKLNAILLQVRPASDALYASTKEPWSEFLSGKAGVSPGYDPLEFAVAEAHARGLELHAWVNPFRAAISASARSAGEPYCYRSIRNGFGVSGSNFGSIPANRVARAYVIGVITDIVRRYDCRWDPSSTTIFTHIRSNRVEASFPDDASWNRYGAQKRTEPGGLAAGEHQRFRAFDVSRGEGGQIESAGRHQPVRHLATRACRQPTKAGLDAYGQLFADSRKWVAEGWVDYLAPQLYWSIRPAEQSFPVLLDWWRAQSHGIPIWPGHRNGADRFEAAGARNHRADRADAPGHFIAGADSLEHESADAKPGRDR